MSENGRKSNGVKLPDLLSREEMRRLLAAPALEVRMGLRNRVILEIMYRAGLRTVEVIHLQPSDLRWDAGQGLLELHYTKGERERVVPINPELRYWLQRWERERIKEAPTFFHTRDGKPLRSRDIREWFKILARKAGLEESRVHPHALRHTFASERLEEGFSITEVQTLLGHANVTTTQIYLHARPEALAEKMLATGPRREVKKTDPLKYAKLTTEDIDSLSEEELKALEQTVAALRKRHDRRQHQERHQEQLEKRRQKKQKRQRLQRERLLERLARREREREQEQVK